MDRENNVRNISRLFIGLKNFDTAWKHFGLTDDDRRMLETTLLKDPTTGTLIKGTGGVRKIRQAISGKGKSGGIRVFYYDFSNLGRIYLLVVVRKADQENLSLEERNELGAMISAMKRGLK